jgi:hypothetical protein
MKFSSTLVTAVLALGATACSSPDPGWVRPPGPSSTGQRGGKVSISMSCPAKPADPSRTRVMVVDDGFDLRHPAFSGKLAGCYQIECPEEPSFSWKPGESDDDAATRMVELLRTPGPTCTLKESFTLEVDDYLEEFDPAARDEFNDAFLRKHPLEGYSSADVDWMFEATGSGAYHGTATAGAVAYQNDVDIVVVQIKLGSSDDILDQISCLQQENIDLESRLFARPDVAEAYTEAPLYGREKAIVDLRRQHGVRVENRSFGPISTAFYETLLRLKGCTSVKLEEHERIAGQLDARRDAVLRANGAFAGTETLVFQSSGNDAQKIDDAGQDGACTPNRVDRALVGAYDIYRARPVEAFFTNYGACVDAYALGEAVVLPTAAGFYGTFVGTSFSSPLAARYASTLAAGAPTTAALRDRVYAARDENLFLPLSTMPVELHFFSKEPVGSTTRQTVAWLPVESGSRGSLSPLARR